MATVTEAAAGQNTQINASLNAGLEVLSLKQTLTFVKYVQKILPLDGYIFWVRGDLVNQGATFTAVGSFHYSVDLRQEETNTSTTVSTVFTSETEVRNLNQLAPTVLYIATVDGNRVVFSSRGKYYKVADLHHYTGIAVQNDMRSQIVDDLSVFNAMTPIVSNSLPLWLALNTYSPIYPTFTSPVTLYPAFLVPANINPPFGAVSIKPETTVGLSAAPAFANRFSQSQLVKETVEITLYGLQNDEALDFLACVGQFSADYGLFGIMNMPCIRDERRPQVEIGALAQMKTLVFDINYVQGRSRDVARQLILDAPITYQP